MKNTTYAALVTGGAQGIAKGISPCWIAVEDWQKQSERQAPELQEIDHRHHLSGRVGHPPDVAHLTSFLLSGQTVFITGQDFIVDGGMTKRMIYEE